MRDPESEGSDEEGDDEFLDKEGKMYTTAGMEVIAFSSFLKKWQRILFKPFKFIQIDRASAGNVKRSKEEIEADPEEENQFGYTTSE